MKEKMRTIKQTLAQQQRRVVLLALAIALFTSTLFLLQHSLAQNSSGPRRSAAKSAAKSRARAQDPTNFQPIVKWAVAQGTSTRVSLLPVKAPKLFTTYKSNWPRRIKDR